MGSLVSIRPAHTNELEAVNYLLTSEGFDTIESLEGVHVAANEDDELVGFIRIAICDDGWAYIYPVVVYETWRAFGVGRSLVRHAMETYGSLKLVSRGWVNTFYDSLGFVKADWNEIDESIARDCDDCEMYGECHPQPYRFERGSR